MIKRILLALLVLAALFGLYVWVVLKWSYSSGERAGWVQKLSNKGWLCKTWEGELAMVSMPGAASEKFYFTVHNEAVAQDIQQAMGKRVSLHYEEKVGIPSSCFGETRHFVNKVTVASEIPLAPGVNVPTTTPVPAAAPGAAPAAVAAPAQASAAK